MPVQQAANLSSRAAIEINTPGDFAHALLQKLGLPTSDNNIQALVAAQAVEGGHIHNAAMFNPLNTTWKMPNSHAVTKIGVQSYNSWDDGLTATAKTFSNGPYKDILAAFARSATPDETLKLDGWRTWGWDRAVGKAADYQSYASVQFPNKESGAFTPTNKIEPPTTQPTDMVSQIESLLSRFLSAISTHQTTEALISKADYQKYLPLHQYLIKINANDICNAIEFSRVLCTALDEELMATASTHMRANEIEVECIINGDKALCTEAVVQLCSALSYAFEDATQNIGGITVTSHIIPDKKSNYQQLGIKLAEINYDVFHNKIARARHGN